MIYQVVAPVMGAIVEMGFYDRDGIVVDSDSEHDNNHIKVAYNDNEKSRSKLFYRILKVPLSELKIKKTARDVIYIYHDTMIYPI